MEGFELAFPPLSRPACRVRVGSGVFDALVRDLLGEQPAGLSVVVTDERVGPLHADPLIERLRAGGLRVESLTVPRGEACKTRDSKARVEDRLLELGAGRDTLLVAVGGGTVCDLTGFVAATWQRGIPVIQVPTSLLAMVDAALGGKTAVNLADGKNLVGAFHQPLGVYADVAVLATLEEQDFTDGFAEIVKTAAIADAELFGRLEASTAALRSRHAELLEQVVGRCMRIKADVVRDDERETGRRAVLNFGHTVAHAIEAVSGYGIRHGPAVAIGLAAESRLACRETGFPAEDAARIAALLGALGLPCRLPAEIGADRVVAAARRDKKNRDGRIHCALPHGLGRMAQGDRVTVAVEESSLSSALMETTGPAAD